MRLSVLLALGTFAVALAPVACASPTEEAPISSPADEGDAEDELKSLSITDADNGKTVTITKGQSLLVKLKSNPTTGFNWLVASTDRSFGHAASARYVANSGGAVGSGGLQLFTWKTTSPLVTVGSHKVKLEYGRPWGTDLAPAKVFTFTVKILDGNCPQLSPPAPSFCPNGTVTPKHNADGCINGYQCVADCRTKGCWAGSTCTLCCAQMACINTNSPCPPD